MADLASLGIVVKTQGVEEAEKQLDSLAKTGAQTEQAAKKLGPAVDSVGKAAAKTAPAMQKTAMSAGELKNALRQLPAQFTDIATGLASGQRPLQVLLQQGGQLKDSFNGIGPAAKALGGYIAGLVNPYTLAAAAVGGLAIAWNQAESEAAGFNRALALTGNQAGLTAQQLEAMARTLDGSTSATQSKASEVLAQVAATGQFTAEQIQMVASAAIQMEEATGRAIGDTVKEFASLKGDPVDAILKLNDAVGDGTNITRFLTQETLDQIKALKDQGREADATAVAMRALYDAIEQRAPAAVQALTPLQIILRDMKHGAAEFGDAIVHALNRVDGPAQQAAKRLGNVAEAFGLVGVLINRGAQVYGASVAARANQGPKVNVIRGNDPASLKIKPPSRTAIVDGATERQRQEFERAGLRYLDDTAQKKREIADVQKLINAGVIKQAEGEKRIAEINDFYARKGPKAKKPRAISDADSGVSLLQQIQQQIALTEQELATGEKLTASDRLRVQMDSLLADSKSKVTAATREQLSAGLEQLKAAEDYKEIAETNALIDREAADAKAEVIDRNQRHAEAIAQLTDEMQFELDLLGKTAVEQARMIALRQAGVTATDAERDAIGRLAEELYRAQEQQAALDDIKYAATDMFASFLDGSKSAGDAFEDFADRLKRIAAQMLAEKAIQWLAGLFMNGGWGDSGGASGTSLFSQGWATGGYTGPGGKYQPAGVVHKGEVVFSQSDVARNGGVAAVEAMRLGLRGYASGGVVGGSAMPSGRGFGNVIINAPPGSSATTEERDRGDGSGMKDLVVFIENTARGAISKDVSQRSGVGRLLEQTYGLSRQGVQRG